MVFQLLIGLPLELVHKCHRVCIVYTLGVIAGLVDAWKGAICTPKTSLPKVWEGVMVFTKGVWKCA